MINSITKTKRKDRIVKLSLHKSTDKRLPFMDVPYYEGLLYENKLIIIPKVDKQYVYITEDYTTDINADIEFVDTFYYQNKLMFVVFVEDKRIAYQIFEETDNELKIKQIDF